MSVVIRKYCDNVKKLFFAVRERDIDELVITSPDTEKNEFTELWKRIFPMTDNLTVNKITKMFFTNRDK